MIINYKLERNVGIMRIKKIHLKDNYKRFKDLTIDLGDNPRKIIALVGPNGCGKSSVMDSILVLNNIHFTIGNKGTKQSWYHSLDQNTYKELHQITKDIEIVTDKGDLKSLMNSIHKTKNNTYVSFRSSYRYNQELRVTQISSTDDIKLNQYGASSATDIDDKMDENFRRLYAHYNKYLEDNDLKPSEAKAIIIGELNEAIKNCLNISLVSLGNIEANKGTLYFSKSDHPSNFDFNVLSSGEKEVIDILLDLYLRKEHYQDTIFLIDEPELHISTAIQKKLLIEINRMIHENCQVWIATHSIGFLRTLKNELKDECQVIHFKEGIDWASTKQILYPIISSHLVWKDIFRVAIDDLSTLITPNIIVYCEGKHTPSRNGNEQGLDAIVYNIIFGQKYSDVLFISSGGNTELDHRSSVAFIILSKVFKDLQILVLKDRDLSSGQISNDTDRELYLASNPTNHRVLKRFEIENNLYDKEVLKAYCFSNGLSFDEKTYDARITDIKDCNVKDQTGLIKNICSIKVSIDPETFKKELARHITIEMNVFKELEECVFNSIA